MPYANYKQFVNLVLGYNYYDLNVVGDVTPKPEFIPSRAPRLHTTSNTIPSVPARNYHNLCGNCGEPAYKHYNESTVANAEWHECTILAEFISLDRAYGDPKDTKPSEVFEHTDRYGLPLLDLSGNGTSDDMKEDDSEDYVPDVTFTDQSTYYDKFPNEHTSALNWTYTFNGVTRSGTYDDSAPQRQLKLGNLDTTVTRNFYVDGDAGYMTHVAYEPFLTELYHNRLLNIFKDQAGYLRVGSIQFRKNTDLSVTGVCVRNDCNGRIHLNYADQNRDNLETFIYQVIRHGNNHAAKFITSRPDWYKLHNNKCDLNCTGIACNDNAYYPDSLTASESLEFVMEHRRYCKTPECKCGNWLKAMLAANLENNHNLKVGA